MQQLLVVESLPILTLKSGLTLVDLRDHQRKIDRYNLEAKYKRVSTTVWEPIRLIQTIEPRSLQTLEALVKRRADGAMSMINEFDKRIGRAVEEICKFPKSAFEDDSDDEVDEYDTDISTIPEVANSEIKSRSTPPLVASAAGNSGTVIVASDKSGDLSDVDNKGGSSSSDDTGSAATAPASSKVPSKMKTASLLKKSSGISSSSSSSSSSKHSVVVVVDDIHSNEWEALILNELSIFSQPKTRDVSLSLLRSVKCTAQWDWVLVDQHVRDFMQIYHNLNPNHLHPAKVFANVLWHSLPAKFTKYVATKMKQPETIAKVVRVVEVFSPLYSEMLSLSEQAQPYLDEVLPPANKPLGNRFQSSNSSSATTPKAAGSVKTFPVAAMTGPPKAPTVERRPYVSSEAAAAGAFLPSRGLDPKMCIGCGHVTSPPHHRFECPYKHLPGYCAKGACTSPISLSDGARLCAVTEEIASPSNTLTVGPVAEAQGMVAATLKDLNSSRAIATVVGLDSYCCHSVVSPEFAARLKAQGVEVTPVHPPFVVGVAGGAQVACRESVRVFCQLRAPGIPAVEFEVPCVVTKLPASVNLLLSWNMILRCGLQAFMPGFLPEPVVPVCLPMLLMREPPAEEELNEDFHEVTYPIEDMHSDTDLEPIKNLVGIPMGIIAAVAQPGVGSLRKDIHTGNSKEVFQEKYPYIAFEDYQHCADMLSVVELYPTVFSNTFPAEGTLLPAMKVEMVDADAMPRRMGPRRSSPQIQNFVKTTVDKLLALKFIVPSSASNPSPIVVARSATRDWRLCIDYTEVNLVTRRLPYPLPNIKDLLQRMSIFNWYAKLDLRKGFHQVGLDPASREYSAFVCTEGIFEWQVIPFGFLNGPTYFQWLLCTIVLQGLVGKFCFVYIDDVIIGGSSQKILIDNVALVVERFAHFRLILNTAKCQIGVEKIEYLGQTLSAVGVSVTDQRRQGLHQLVPPSDIKTLRSVLGLFNYFRDYIPSYAVIASPLYDLTKKGVVFRWDSSHQQAFVTLREAVITAPMLFHIDYKLPVIVRTDASCVAIGGTIIQPTEEGERIVATRSQLLSAAARRWSTRDQEAFAVFNCIQAWSHFLLGHPFTIETDHRNLTFIMKSSEGRVYRWRIYLQQYDYSVLHIPGVDNVVADGLSRCVLAMVNGDQPTIISQDAVGTQISTVIDSRIQGLIHTVHNDMAGHFGIDTTLYKLRQNGTTWKHMRRDVVRSLQQCVVCQKQRIMDIASKAKGARQVLECYEPFQVISLDTLSCPVDDEGYNCILVAVCNFTRYVEIVAATDHTAETWATFLLRICCRFGSPQYLHSDRGSEFVNKIIQQMVAMFKCTQRLTIGYRPQANGMVERVNSEIIRHLSAIVLSDRMGSKWSLGLPLVMRILNAHVSRSTGIAPAELVYGGTCNLDRGLLKPFESPKSVSMTQYTAALYKYQSNAIAGSQRFLAAVMDRRVEGHNHQEVVEIPVNSYVVISYPEVAPKGDKFATPWRGPYLVKSREHNNYSVMDLRTKKIIVVDASRLKVFQVAPGVDPVKIAALDENEDVVDSIVEHRNESHKRGKTFYEFLVQWEDGSATWEKYSNIRNNIALDQYVVTHPELMKLFSDNK